MNCLGKLHLLRIEIVLSVFGELPREDQHAVQRRAQLVRHIREKLGLIF